ncbi:MAG: 3-keto-5-aminohexanoate cleavage protein [Pseudomonadota bacterium]
MDKMERPLIINLAPTGAVADASKNPRVPLTLEAIVEDVKACADRGVSMAHIHVRDENGAPSCEPARFARVFEAVRESNTCADVVLIASTSGRHGQTLDQRAAVLHLPADVRPDMGSLTLGSLNFVTGASVNAPDTIRALVDHMNDAGVKPELEVFDVGMIEFAKVLIAEGRIKPPFYFNLLLGNIGALQATPQHLGFALSLLPENSFVSVAGIGRYQRVANALGAVSCDGVRVGLEDNLWADQSTRAPASNALLTERVATLCEALGRPIATPQQTRELLALPGR